MIFDEAISVETCVAFIYIELIDDTASWVLVRWKKGLEHDDWIPYLFCNQLV